MRLMQTLGAAGALVITALVGGTLINSASANPEVVRNEDGGEYCDLFLDSLGAELGVEADAIAPAVRSAATSTIETMVEAGDLPAQLGERMTSRLNASDGDGCAVLGARFHGAVRHAAVGEFRSGMLDAAASTLGLESSVLRERLADGSSLNEIAETEGIAYTLVISAALASAQADVDAAVNAGTMRQERADRIIERIGTWLDAGGEPRERPSRD